MPSRRNVEEGGSSVEVVVHPVPLCSAGLPGGVVEVGVEGVVGVGPGIVKALDRLVVLLLACSDHQVLVLDDSAIAKGHLAGLGVDLLDARVVRLPDVLVDELASRGLEIELGDAG